MTKYKTIPELSEERVSRFWSNVSISNNDSDCWLWHGAKDDCGYGRFSIKGSCFSAHRISYFLKHSINPINDQVLHHCDVPACCNPHHFFTGTHQDNMKDRENKGRGNHPSGVKHGTKTKPESVATGERNGHYTHPEATLKGSQKPNAKLNDCQVMMIRELCRSGDKSYTEISKMYNVTVATIEYIAQGKTWRHLPIGEVPKSRYCGNDSKLSKLTEDNVLAMRNLYSNGGESYSSLSDKFSISKTQVALIINGKSWKHILFKTA